MCRGVTLTMRRTTGSAPIVMALRESAGICQARWLNLEKIGDLGKAKQREIYQNLDETQWSSLNFNKNAVTPISLIFMALHSATASRDVDVDARRSRSRYHSRPNGHRTLRLAHRLPIDRRAGLSASESGSCRQSCRMGFIRLCPIIRVPKPAINSNKIFQ